MAEDWWADLAPSTCLILIAAFARHQQGTWLAPGPFFCLTWCLLVWTALVMAPDIDVWPAAIWWISGSAVATYVGSVVGLAAASRFRTVAKRPARYLPPRISWIVLCSGAGLAGVGVLLQSRGLGLGSVVSLQNLADVAREFSVARYQEGYREPLLATVCITGTYLAALLAGILLASEGSTARRVMAFLPVIPAVGVAAVETTKAAIYFVVILMTASYLAARVVSLGRHERLVTWPRVYKVGMIVGILGALSLAIQLSRYGYSASNANQLDEVLTRMHVFLFGYLGGFAEWLRAQGGVQLDLGLGTSSFAGLAELVTGRVRPIGVYQESVYLGSASIPTNIYTIFRGLIQDFGLVGSMVALASVGFIAGWAFGRVGEGDTKHIPTLAAFYAATLWSAVINLFVYNSLLLAWLLLTAYLFTSNWSLVPGRQSRLLASHRRDEKSTTDGPAGRDGPHEELSTSRSFVER